MAASLVLRRGAGALKTVLLEARVFRGFASTVSLSAESGKNEKGLPPNPKKQSPAKNVVEPEERGQLLTTQTAAALSKGLSPPSAPRSVGSRGRTLAGPHNTGSVLLTDEGHPEHWSRKTLVEFPQKVPSAIQEQGPDSKAWRVPRNGKDDSSSSSSTSSSSSSSDSESDEEGSVSESDPRVVSKGKRGFPKPEATRPFEKKPTKAVSSAEENSRVQTAHTDSTRPGQPRPPKKIGPSAKAVEGKKEARPKPTIPSSQASEGVVKKNIKKEELQKIFRSNETDEESQKPVEDKKILCDRTKARLPTWQGGSAVSTAWTEEAKAGPSGAQGKHLEAQVPGPEWKAASPLVREENLEKPVTEGHSKATGGTLEDQVAAGDVKTADVSDEKAAGLQPEGRGTAAQDAAPCTDVLSDPQESTEPANATTYKNLQHHSYNTYTFLDLNSELSKFRMPQPSSGRASPRH